MVSYMNQKKPETNQENTTHYHHNSIPTTPGKAEVIQEVNAKEKGNDGTENRNESNDGWWKKRYKDKNFRGWLMVGATIGAMVFTGSLVCSTSEQIKLTKESMVKQNRAYLGYSHVEADSQFSFDNGKDYQMKLIFKNSGVTPAFKSKIVTQIARFIGQFPNDPPYKNLRPAPSRGIIGGGETIRQPIKPLAEVDPPILQELKIGNGDFYIYGTVTYEDVFRCEHVHHFCIRYSLADKDFITGDTYNDEETSCYD
jgi:hypothetical protein